MTDLSKFSVVFALACVIVPIFALLAGCIFYLVWNNILVDIVSVFKEITYWKSFFLCLAVMFPSTLAKYKTYDE